MIIDITGIELTPGNGGKDCKGNGNHFDENGKLYECCCDECDYMLCCINEDWNLSDYIDLSAVASKHDCKYCSDTECPRNKN